MKEPKLETCLKSIIIVGVGSIGKKHLEISLRFSQDIYVIDPSSQVNDYIKNHPSKSKIKIMHDIEDFKKPVQESLVVISNWGPDHFRTFKSFVEKGFKSFIIEKPLVSRLTDLVEMETLIHLRGLDVKTNMPWSYSNFSESVSDLVDFQKLGSLKNISVSGGAKCLATIGIHHIGLAIQLFQSAPISVMALLRDSKINPRNSELAYLEGTSSWQFSHQRFLAMTFSNESHLQAVSILTYTFGRIIIEGNEATIFRISDSELNNIARPVDTYSPSVRVGSFPPFNHKVFGDGTSYIYNSFFKNITSTEVDFGVAATRSLFGMLVSNDMQEVIHFPFEDDLLNKYSEVDWKIS
jgi:predicted dehydrogenase